MLVSSSPVLLLMQPITRIMGNMSITTDQAGGVLPVIDQLYGVMNQSLALDRRREPATILLGNYTTAGLVTLPLAWGSPSGMSFHWCSSIYLRQFCDLKRDIPSCTGCTLMACKGILTCAVLMCKASKQSLIRDNDIDRRCHRSCRFVAYRDLPRGLADDISGKSL